MKLTEGQISFAKEGYQYLYKKNCSSYASIIMQFCINSRY